ncbi:hypothetical protein PN462_06370 [Spirulina sp. CS-785/01]|uniref:hypothetical protein n=1 Tax=Spirulina sp. CS-785/01 TaxID=3021716 RepID=UPI00232AF8AD|nr:hypothetical protein [Spirulina sp. CS-785/01]MDB9312719.1 hypothetical protein [Spirulina sp. CS-785/01]
MTSRSIVSNMPSSANESTAMNNNTPTPDTEGQTLPERKIRKQPIPPASEARQYRAIGLVQGRYHPSEEQQTKGTVIADDGTELDAVLLGRVISLVKNHLDLSQSHLWVVYPRTRQDDEQLHIQITGVWEPELLHTKEEQEEAANLGKIAELHSQDGYFSIRGEVVYYSFEEEKVVVRIQQTPRKKTPPKKFTLQLKGLLPERPLKHFWELHVVRQGSDLIIQEAHDFGFMKPAGGRKGQFKGKKRPPRKPQGSRDQGPREKPSKPQKSNHG